MALYVDSPGDERPSLFIRIFVRVHMCACLCDAICEASQSVDVSFRARFSPNIPKEYVIILSSLLCHFCVSHSKLKKKCR